MIQYLTRLIVRIGPERLGPLLPILRWASRSCRKVACGFIGLGDDAYRRRTGDRMMPPAGLRFRVHGAADIESFLESGRITHERIGIALQRQGRSVGDFQKVLDWGCGCGRTLRWFREDGKSVRFFGTDIDAVSIDWARKHLSFAEFAVNEALPPLPYPDSTFDLIYAVSVLTHLDEDYQFQWLQELNRVAAPSALLLLSIHARSSWVDLSPRDRAALEKLGFLYLRTQSWKGIFPDWYQNAFHTRAYVEERFADMFEVVAFYPEGMSERQDLVLLRNG